MGKKYQNHIKFGLLNNENILIRSINQINSLD